MMEYRDYEGEVWEASYLGKKWQHELIEKTSTSVKVMAKAYLGDDAGTIGEVTYYG